LDYVTTLSATQNNSTVSVIIPCRDEQDYIKFCLDSIIANDYPKEKLQVLVVDGMSEDGTRQIIKEYTQRHSNIFLLDNKKKITPSALNIGIKNAKSEIIIRADAHAKYAKDYISKCVRALERYDVDNVGGTMITLPRNDSIIGKAIVKVISNPFGVGNSKFRTHSDNIIEVDTVFGGCYKREIFDKIGLFNEKLKKGQDWELNNRLKQSGGKILLVPEIVSYYYARSSLNISFFHFYYGEGFWAVYPVKYVGKRFYSFWRMIPAIFVATLFISGILSIFIPTVAIYFNIVVALYLLVAIVISSIVSIKEKKSMYLLVMPVIFLVIHVCYGIGTIVGLSKILVSKVFNRS